MKSTKSKRIGRGIRTVEKNMREKKMFFSTIFFSDIHGFFTGSRYTEQGRCFLILGPAIAAGVIDELWDFERLYDEVTEHTYGD